MVTRSKAWVCGLSLAGTAVSYSVANMAFSCECCEFWGRSLCDGPILRPEESYREKERHRGCVCVCVCHWVWSGTTIILKEQVEEGRLRKKEVRCLIGELVYDVNNILFAMLCSVYEEEFRRREKKFWAWGEQIKYTVYWLRGVETTQWAAQLDIGKVGRVVQWNRSVVTLMRLGRCSVVNNKPLNCPSNTTMIIQRQLRVSVTIGHSRAGTVIEL